MGWTIEKRATAGRSRGHSTGGGWRAFCEGYGWKRGGEPRQEWGRRVEAGTEVKEIEGELREAGRGQGAGMQRDGRAGTDSGDGSGSL